ncbi:cuticular protein RR-1 family member 20 isoform X1 [Nasonia vitripennis]|uniref:Uncharacterized protein n=1 Tax=Nasonia vitripennis TaxID=7425 RepID=A0A7M6UMF3_NASVI|nr:cuticular protein RR-1 family member 20 precursor [Nasonia vitripennis]XP_008208811.1 cuticular protein RR-1 family member 20 isoform X1 [Nasonia vitripennis]
MFLRVVITVCLLHSAIGQRFNRPIPSPAGNAGGAAGGPSDILNQVSDISPDGTFYTKWETANGITFEEQGSPKNLGNEVAEQVQGSASWTTNEGERVSITWQADENGAIFQGDHLPTAPPAPEIPLLIQRALDWIAANPSKLSTPEEGQYNEDDGAGAARPQPNLQQRRPPAPGRRF